ncbi:MAG: tRNA (adenosine(37)-N6)-threonylcarbamoyltransferase complex dimerization subunit type 1 TsaB [Bdellovibrionota bacterium]
MLLLGLESSHSEGSLSLQRDSQILETFSWKQEKSHAELLAGFLVKALKNHNLKQSDIDAYAVNVGPGSFTGIRISINTIKTLGFFTHKPIYTFNSLETIAQGASLDDQKLLVAINAHSELCYVGKFVSAGNNWMPAGEIEVASALKLNDLLKQPNTLFVGDAFEYYKDKIDSSLEIKRPKTFNDIPSAVHLNQLALLSKDSKKPISWEALEPLYVRLSSPEEKLKPKGA